MNPCCNAIEVTNVPGPTGNTGAGGSNGVNAFTITTATFVLPAAMGTVTLLVGSSLWMAVGQNLFVSDGTNVGNFKVVSFPSATAVLVQWLNYSGDAATGTTFAANATVTPSGLVGPTPANTFANGLTTGTTKATAQTNLGLGQDALISTGSGLTQAITATSVQVGAISITIPALGSWLYSAYVDVDFLGVTFSANRTITAKIRNITQNTDLASVVLHTQAQTTQNMQTTPLHIPFLLDTTAAIGDVLQLWIVIDVINSAGTLSVIGGSLCAIPLRKS
jgi:hypothetical protein